MAFLLGVAAILVVVGMCYARAFAVARRYAEAIRGAFREVGVEPYGGWDTDTIRGQIRGVWVDYQVEGGSKYSRAHERTVCSASVTGVPRCELGVRPRDLENPVSRFEVRTGDPQFDSAFIVESAPAWLARAVLDASMRAALLALTPCQVEWNGNALRLTKKGCVDELPKATRLLETMGELCAHVSALPGQLEEQRLLAAARETSGYRGATAETSEALDDAAWKEAEELALANARRP
jgi:hypothetical protein